jgi:predicted TIM-barrel fold metal-dependent hydrolase
MTSSTSADRVGLRPYIDGHSHIGDTINRVPPCGQTPEKFLGRMAESGIIAALFCPAGGGPQARGVLDTRDQHTVIATACRRYPRRFPIGLAIFEMRQQQAGVDEIARAMDEDGLLGFMCHPSFSAHSLGPELEPALDVVDARGGIALLHAMGGPTEAQIAAHARQFRRTTFIAVHVSMRAEQHRTAIQALAGLENVWFDFAQHPASADTSWDIADLVRGFGPERLLFGSDSPYYDHRLLQRQIEAAPLDDAIKDRIAWRNAADLIERFRPDWRPDFELPAVPAEFVGTDLWEELPGKPGRLR